MKIDQKELRRRESLVAKEYGGVLPYCEAFYIFSILYSADRANEAFRRFTAACRDNAEAMLVTSAVHEALGHSAALSRFFWPSRDKGVANARAATLRKAFQLDDSSPLKDRSLRDALEHFDERLDQFLLVNDAGHFFPTPMIDDHTLVDEPTAKIFKLVDPTEGYFAILGKKYQFEPIMPEVARIPPVQEPNSKLPYFSCSQFHP